MCPQPVLSGQCRTDTVGTSHAWATNSCLTRTRGTYQRCSSQDLMHLLGSADAQACTHVCSAGQHQSSSQQLTHAVGKRNLSSNLIAISVTPRWLETTCVYNCVSQTRRPCPCLCCAYMTLRTLSVDHHPGDDQFQGPLVASLRTPVHIRCPVHQGWTKLCYIACAFQRERGE